MSKMPYPAAPPPPYSAQPTVYYETSNSNQITQQNNYPQSFDGQLSMNHLTFEQKFHEIIQKYEISHYFASKLQLLRNFKIAFIFDDSGSMNTILHDSPLNRNNNLIKATRWDELQYFANISIEIASIFNPEEGCDVYFLNRFPSPVRRIVNVNQLSEYFKAKPQGFTPLTQTLYKVLNDNAQSDERKLLVIICTDGEPTDSAGRVNISEFKQSLMTRPIRVHTTIVACTDDDDSVGYLNHWDRSISRLGNLKKRNCEETKNNILNFSLNLKSFFTIL